MVRGDSHLHTALPWLKQIAKECVYPFFLKKFSACLATGQWSAEYFHHYRAKRVILSPHFIDNDWFSVESEKSRQQKTRLRELWNIPQESTVYLFAGKFEEKKKPLDVLHALHEIKNKTPEVVAHVLMVGDGKLKNSCEDFSKSRGLAVSFTGFLNQSEMPKAYGVSDVLVLPSDGRETWGLVVNEAMACGLPAIVSDLVGCGPDLIEEGQTGHFFSCGHVMELAEKMLRFTRPGYVAEMGQNTRRRISGYTVDAAAHGILEALI